MAAAMCQVSFIQASSAIVLSSSASVASTSAITHASCTTAAVPCCPVLAVRCEQPASETVDVSRRGFSMAAAALMVGAASPALFASPARALLDADEDEELLERIKRERKEKIELRESRGSYKAEESEIQAAVYGLSKVGQALEGGDFAAASAALSAGWVAKADEAIAKISVSDEEKSLASTFQSATDSLKSAVAASDASGSKEAFIASAKALEGWSSKAGLAGELLGL